MLILKIPSQGRDPVPESSRGELFRGKHTDQKDLEQKDGVQTRGVWQKAITAHVASIFSVQGRGACSRLYTTGVVGTLQPPQTSSLTWRAGWGAGWDTHFAL